MNQYGGNNECRLSNKIDTFKEQLEFRKISKLTIDQIMKILIKLPLFS